MHITREFIRENNARSIEFNRRRGYHKNKCKKQISKFLNFPYFKVKYLNKFQDRYMFQISEDGAQKTVYCPFMRKLSEPLFCLQLRKNICMKFKIK